MSIQNSTALHPSFQQDILNKHLVYDYHHKNEKGETEEWRYEIWFFSSDRVVYAIHGGPMKGRLNYQTCAFQCIRPGQLWQCNWLEETGTIVSLVYDITEKKISTCIAFSKGHWENPEKAHGDKRNADDFDRWRSLAEMGNQKDRVVLIEQADISEVFEGKGDLVPIAPDAVTL
ncbi:putative phenol acid carboxylase [Planoprotostelium fungivorum]|uniref:Putative phenol acid carboxylase n=1 Tax=Planoprotostelium fungivorum TaxID=1890364 RepID=A0A2P6NBD2_9EUKA|nr:putative phenol acid carboxylase [Planoprotostelium fungivorum]